MVQQMKRDREEEMIHRGTEYARAIKKYYKKFGRYPANLEQLDNTNQIRFLRKRYKDPLTKDGKWKLLNYGDIQTLLNPNAPGTPAAALGAQGQSAFGQPSAMTSVSYDRLGSAQSTPSPGTLCPLPARALTRAVRLLRSNRLALPEILLGASLETRRKATLSRATVLSPTPSAWDRVAPRTPTSREARRQPAGKRRLWLESRRRHPDLWRRSDRRRRQREQRSDHPHLQQEEDLQRMGVHLQPDDGPERTSCCAARTSRRPSAERRLELRPDR